MFKVLKEGCEPKRGSKFSACVDLFASEDVVIGAGETKLVGLGVCIGEDLLNRAALEDMAIESILYPHIDYSKWSDVEKVVMFKNANYLQLMLRSSLGKKGLILPNGVGVIDLDFVPNCKIGKQLNNGTCKGFKQKQKE